MDVRSFYPVLMSEDVAAAADFYRRHLGFSTTFETDWYVSLRRGPVELALLDHRHGTVPDGWGRPAAGVLLNVEVADVDALHQQLVVDGPLEAVLGLRSEAFGQRHFIVAAPDGVLLDLITEIEPAPEFAAAFAAGG